jgi:hypothetical protein
MDKAYKFSNCLAPITVTIPRKKWTHAINTYGIFCYTSD